MADNKASIDPRFSKYSNTEIEAILDGAVQVIEGAVQMTENDDPMSLVSE